MSTPHNPNPDFHNDLYQDFDGNRTGDSPAPLTGRAVQPYTPPPTPAPVVTVGQTDEIMAMAAADFTNIAMQILRPDQRADLMHYAASRMPMLHAAPTPGAIEAYDPGTGSTLYVYPLQPVDHTPPVIAARAPVVDKWAVNFALVSLAGSGAAWMSAIALKLFADAAAILLQALQGIGIFGLVCAVIFGLISVARKKAAAPQIRQSVTNNIETKAVFGARTTVDGSAHIHTR